jgi:phage/plasmid-associated DNA primase
MFINVDRDHFDDTHLTRILSIFDRVPRFRRKIIPYALDAAFDRIQVVGEEDDDECSTDSDDNMCMIDLPATKDTNPHVVRESLRVLRADIESNNTWYKVGCMLYCISEGSDDGLASWIEWTTHKSNWNKVTKYTKEDMSRRWRAMEKRINPVMALKRLVNMAYKLDSQSMAAIIRDVPDDDLLNKCSFDPQDMTIVEYIDKLYREEYVSCNKKTDQYYRFQQETGLWIEPRSRLDKILSIEVGTVVPENLKKYRLRLEEERKQLTPDQSDGLEKLDFRIKNIDKCIGTLRRAGKSSILLELRHWFYNRDFLQLLDQNPNLFSFKNGVYDTRACVLREPNRNDYISIQSPIRLSCPTYAEQQELADYFSKIFPNVIIREYFLDVYAHIFFGGNRFKQIYFWSGAQGNNGKTVTQKLFTAMLGDYSKEVPVTLFTHRHGSSSAASPEQARVVKCRMVTANEPEASDSLNIGFLKARSGNDRYYVRTLYSEGFEADPMFKVNIICNNPPRAEGADNAFWNRVIVFPFVSVFDTKAPDTREEQDRLHHYPADVCIEDKLPIMAQTLAWELTTRLERNGHHPIPVPDVIREQVSIYQRCNDNYIIFLNEFIEKSSNDHDKFRYEDALVKFKQWLSPRAIERRSTNMKEVFKKTLSEHCGVPDEYGQWFGWTLLSDK